MKRMKMVFSFVLFMAVGFSLFAVGKKLPTFPERKPIVDLTNWTADGSVLKDASGNATLTLNGGVKEGKGPFGGKALDFTGLKKDQGILDIGKMAPKLDGFDFAMSLWFRCDEIQDSKANPDFAGNTVGLGLDISGMENIHYQLKAFAGGGINAWAGINPGRWNHLAVVYSYEMRLTQVYVNGYPIISNFDNGVYYPYYHNTSGKWTIGGFKGAIADLQIWDGPINTSQFLNIPFSADSAKELYAKLDALLAKTDNAAGMKTMCDNVRAIISAAEAKKSIFSEDFTNVLKKIEMMENLSVAIRNLKGTSVEKSPFAFIVVRPVTEIKREPTWYPKDAMYTDVIEVIAAKDEYTSGSFLIFPYADIKQGIEFELCDLKDDKGNVIPKSEIEMHFVQNWYQSGWNTYFNGYGSYNPALLLHDPTLLKIDERAKINYLRIDYSTGTKYCDITVPGSVLKHPEFQWAFEPVGDSEEMLPVPCDFGRNRWFWMDIHAPAKAPAGIYKGTVKMKADGKDAGTFTLAMKVLPFSLPRPMTQFDHNIVFTQHLCATGVDEYIKTMKDVDRAWDYFKRHMVNMKKHAMLTQPISIDPDNPDLFFRMAELQQGEGLYFDMVDGGLGAASFVGLKPDEITNEMYWEQLETFKKRVDKIEKLLDDKYGHHENVHFFGIDEAQAPGTFRSMMPFRDYAFRHGMTTMSTGWEENFIFNPSYETYHTTAAFVTRDNAQRWHALNNSITTYAAPFIGPDNPHLMRVSHGIRMYRSNYDGWWELAYGAEGKYHTWNGRFGYDTTYRPFRFVVATSRGPIINTIAFCGMREGQNDVRYCTLLHSLADECFASKDLSKVQVARKAILWFRNQPFPNPRAYGSIDMYAWRAGMIHHILELMKVLGKEMN